MHISGIKVRSITPGNVVKDETGDWYYTLFVNGREKDSRPCFFSSAADAKQAIREDCARLRRKHIL